MPRAASGREGSAGEEFADGGGDRHRADAAVALRQTPPPPPDHLFEALRYLTAHAATTIDDKHIMRRAHQVLAPAATEHSGAGSDMISFGPASQLLYKLTASMNNNKHPDTMAGPSV